LHLVAKRQSAIGGGAAAGDTFNLSGRASLPGSATLRSKLENNPSYTKPII